MLLEIPTDGSSYLYWILGTVIEVLIAISTWHIDYIPEGAHEQILSKWAGFDQFDLNLISSTCAFPVEIGKLTAAAFALSIGCQIAVVIAVHIIQKRRDRGVATDYDGDTTAEALEAVNEADDGLPAIVFASHAIMCFVFSLGVMYYAIDLALHRQLYRHCHNRKVIGLFRFSVVATSVLTGGYFWLAKGAMLVVVGTVFANGSVKDS